MSSSVLDLATLSNPVEWCPRLGNFLRPYTRCWRVGARFRNTERNAQQYLAGLLLPGGRKSMQPMARRVPGADADRLQNFLTDSPWNAEEVQATLVRQIGERFADPDGLLALDDTEFLKQGSASVGVAHQYCGSLGKTANCQTGVTLYYVLPFDRRPREIVGFTVGARLYLPKKWADDPVRRTRARVPPSVVFAEKWQLGLELIDRVRSVGLPHRAVLADAGYGRSSELRAALRERHERYVVGCQANNLSVVRYRKEGTPIDPTPVSVSRLIGRVAESEWQKLVWAEGTKGPLVIELVRYRVRVAYRGTRTDEEGWLILERRPNETKVYLAWGLDGLKLKELARLIRSRWPIELGYRQMKQVVGLNHFEGRTWPGWHHHVTLAAMAHAFLMMLRADVQDPKRSSPSLEEVATVLHGVVMQRILSQAKEIEDPRLRDQVWERACGLADIPLRSRRGRWVVPTTADLGRWETGEPWDALPK